MRHWLEEWCAWGMAIALYLGLVVLAWLAYKLGWGFDEDYTYYLD